MTNVISLSYETILMKFFLLKKPNDWAKSGIGKLLPSECTIELVSNLNIEKDDLLFLAFGDKRQAV